MSIIVVDTNILRQNYMLDTAHWSKLFHGSKRLGIKIYIPDVVLDELLGNHHHDLSKSKSVSENEAKKLEKLGIVYKHPIIDVDRENVKYREYIKKVMRDHDIEIPPYPDISPKVIVKAAYIQKKPFKISGDGYKDYLIFATILELIEATGEDVYFLTDNHHDFCNKNKELHEDLTSQVRDGISVKIYTSIRRIYEDVLKTGLEQLKPQNNPEMVVAAIKDGSFPSVDLKDKLEMILINELCEKSLDLGDIGGPLNEPSATGLIEFEADEDSLEATYLDEGLLNIELLGDVALELFGFIDKSDFYHISEGSLEGIFLDDGDWNDYVVSAYTTMNFQFSLSIVLLEDEAKVESVSIELFPVDQH